MCPSSFSQRVQSQGRCSLPPHHFTSSSSTIYSLELYCRPPASWTYMLPYVHICSVCDASFCLWALIMLLSVLNIFLTSSHSSKSLPSTKPMASDPHLSRISLNVYFFYNHHHMFQDLFIFHIILFLFTLPLQLIFITLLSYFEDIFIAFLTYCMGHIIGTL